MLGITRAWLVFANSINPVQKQGWLLRKKQTGGSAKIKFLYLYKHNQLECCSAC